MKFWEAMKALQEGKKVKPKHWTLKSNDSYYDINSNLGNRFNIWSSDLEVEWEILEDPALYWQWRDCSGSISAFYREDQIEGQEKHAGPWIKTANGFEKAENWEQF
jgi:uncharacterized protein YfaT (DUF1175 family)